MSLLLSSQALDVSKLLDTNLSLLAALPGSKGRAVCVCACVSTLKKSFPGRKKDEKSLQVQEQLIKEGFDSKREDYPWNSSCLKIYDLHHKIEYFSKALLAKYGCGDSSVITNIL